MSADVVKDTSWLAEAERAIAARDDAREELVAIALYAESHADAHEIAMSHALRSIASEARQALNRLQVHTPGQEERNGSHRC